MITVDRRSACEPIGQVLARHGGPGAAEDAFSAEELSALENKADPAASMAARLLVKELVSELLHEGPGGLDSLQVLADSTGAPQIWRPPGSGSPTLPQSLRISMSHDGQMVAAMAVMEAGG